MKKVLVLTSTFPRWVGDTNSPFVFELCRKMAEDKNFQISVLAPHYEGAKEYEMMGKITVYRFRYFLNKFEKLAGSGGILPKLKSNPLYYLEVPFFILSLVKKTISLTKKIKPDIVHAHWIIPQGIAAYYNFLRNGTPYIITSHGSDLHSLGFVSLKRKILRLAKNITVVSNFLREKVREVDPSLLEKTEVIPMGVDTDMFSPKKYDIKLKGEHGIKGKMLLFVGRLAAEKGVKYLIEAMPSVIKQIPNVKLLIIGDGPLKNVLKEKVTRYGIDANVTFLGPMKHDDLPPYFATADIFISPSLREGTPVTYLEAMASGTYLIVGNIPISRELITSKKIGVLIPRDKENIAQTIVEVCRMTLKDRASKLDNQYKLQTVAERFKKLLEQKNR